MADLDKYIAILGLLFCFLLLIYLCKMGYLSRLPLVISVMISCGVWINLRLGAVQKGCRNQKNIYSRRIVSIMSIIIFIILSNCLLSVKLRSCLYERPTIFFILISIAVGLVTLSILYNNSIKFNLVWIICIGIILSWSQLLIFPGLLGVDPWWHQMFTNKIIESYFIPNDLIYSKLPIFHINIAITSLITGLDYKLSSITSSSFMIISCNSLFIYLIANSIFEDVRVGLLSSLVLITANLHINGSYWLIPNSFASIYLIAGIYFILKYEKEKTIVGTILAMLIMACLVWTHALVSLFMSIVLASFYLGDRIYNILYLDSLNKTVPRVIKINMFVLFTVFMISWWSYVSGHITELAKLFSWGYSIDNYFIASRPVGFTENILEKRSLFESLFNDLGANLFFGLSIIGILSMISRTSNSYRFIIAIIGSIPLSIVLFSNFLGLFIYTNRWLFIAELVLSIPLAVSIITIHRRAGPNRWSSAVFIFVLVLVLTFIMIMSPHANVDKPMFSESTAFRNALTESELKSYETVSGFFKNFIKTDQYYSDSQMWYYNRPKKYKSIGDFSEEIYTQNTPKLSEYPILIRKEIVNKPIKAFGLVIPDLGYDVNMYLKNKKFSIMYDSNSVKCYIKNTKYISNFNNIV